MKSNTLSIIAVILVIFVGLFLWGYAGNGATTASVQGSTVAANAASGLTAPEKFYDFGTISMKNGNVTKEFVVTNPTDKDVTASTLVTSCMCTAAFFVLPDGSAKGPFGMPGMGSVPPVNDVIKAGESRAIRVIYNPNAHGPAGVGQIDRFVTLTDAAGAAIEFEIKALVTP
ncbi:hypothetical protein A3G63_03260 [Candidatus Kaiserbacteria bacterium RIFCSPLOWO2_12_FULL_52_8]|uniref:DUF1573 domain-containing protein n=1 Tax=Candidatus Kaiserbacteria bacterium RIFCSPHIGHO2_01_FULL_53_31 TaxID=1798481 RepID=A0A1F6CJ60_9BACT|nr:MAG: hypothetical protein A2678_02490 [Candidatus Kaiserbacteria bacterium RIFCSPHIGHO2_01_FULL_53_31]OGG93512.1 MAG: hypothetical protein A3G63_03260 [Candidatus Kaiserbacteria bacterium RIFCSPLOWO2_12_FULL_52_8]